MSPPKLETKMSSTEQLKGIVTINVILPSGRDILMSVKRNTPMMDLLVQIATANKISPGSHVIHATSSNGNVTVSYKPSTPIGALGSCIINIVPKNQLASTNAQKLKLVNTPFEQTVRLQVFLPRNQLYVTRISPKIKIADILTHVCSEKNLDPLKYSVRHPSNLSEVLDSNLCLADYKLTQVAVVSSPSRSVSMSSINVTELKSNDSSVNYSRTQSLSANFKNDSLTNINEKSHPAIVIPTRPPKKRRPAPKPPQVLKKNIAQVELPTGDSDTTVISHSRNSSDSSGYHETSVLGESPDIDFSFSEPLSCRNKLSSCSEMSQYQTLPSLSRSLSNLTTVGSNLGKAPSIHHSVSTTCLPSATRRKKKAPSPPPKFMLKSNVINEETSSSCSRPETESISSLCTSSILSDCEPNAPLCGEMLSASQSCLSAIDPHETKAATLPANTKLPDIQCVVQDEDENITDTNKLETESDPAHVNEDEVYGNGGEIYAGGSIPSSKFPELSQSEVKMNDEEIDRIFKNATQGHESSINTPLSSLDPSLSPTISETAEKSCLKTLDALKADSMENHKKKSLSWQAEDVSADTENWVNADSFESNPSELVLDLPVLKQSPSPVKENDIDHDLNRDLSEGNLTSSDLKLKDEKLAPVTSAVPSVASVIPKEPQPSVKNNSTLCTKAVVENHSNPSLTNVSSTVRSKDSNSAASKMVKDEKHPVINELKSVINDQATFKVKKSVPFKTPELKRSASVLDNFKISAYHTIKKPIHILSDSLESSSFNDPYKESNIKKSLSIIYDQNAIFGRPLKPIQRSTSHVSLSNVGGTRYDPSFKSNLPTFKNLKSKVVSNGNLAASSENLLKYCSTSNLRKISSEICLTEDKKGLSSWKNESPFKSREIEADSELQSLQVMKTILPQLRKSCSNLTEINESASEQSYSKTIENIESEQKVFKVPQSLTATTLISSPKFVEPPPSQLKSSPKNHFFYNPEVKETNKASIHSPNSARSKVVDGDKVIDSSNVSRIPTVKSVELKKNAYSTLAAPSIVPDYKLVSLSSYNRFGRVQNVGLYSSNSDEQTNGRILTDSGSNFNEFKEQKVQPHLKSYPFERSFSKENSTFSENYLKNSMKSNELKSVILNDDKKSSLKFVRESPPKMKSEKNSSDLKRDLTLDRVRDASASKKFSGVPPPTPPPAFVMPKLKPASRREIRSPRKDVDPKDLLLNSIRTFGGISSLKKTGNVI